MIEFRRQFQYYYNHFSIMFNNRYRNDSFFLIILQFLFYVFVFFSLGINVFIGIIIDITVNNLWSTSFFWWYLFIFCYCCFVGIYTYVECNCSKYINSSSIEYLTDTHEKNHPYQPTAIWPAQMTFLWKVTMISLKNVSARGCCNAFS